METDVTWMYIGSSCSWPVSWSTNQEPRPLICTRVPVSCWIYLTNIPYANMSEAVERLEIGRTDGPTTLARTLKFRMVSIPTGIFSSGHLRCTRVGQSAGSSKARAHTLSLVRELLSSTNEPMSIAISSLTFSMAF